VKTVVPEHFIDIDDEIQYYDNNPKKLARQKKMNGYGRRYIADEKTTVVDMACFAAEKLMAEMGIAKNDIDLLIFVNQNPDYTQPCDACVAHGRLALNTNCTTIDISLGCSGYVHALMTAHAMMASGAYRTALVLAGDLPARLTDQTFRKQAPVFGDAASATVLRYVHDNVIATFVTGTDGSGWDKIIHPAGGMALPLDSALLSKRVVDKSGHSVCLSDCVMQGEDVFNFTMEIAPRLIVDTVSAAGWEPEDVDFFAIHQANKQIVDMVIEKAHIPVGKSSSETFSKYANNSTNSVATVLCDVLKGRQVKNVILCAFGIGLSWGGGD